MLRAEETALKMLGLVNVWKFGSSDEEETRLVLIISGSFSGLTRKHRRPQARAGRTSRALPQKSSYFTVLLGHVLDAGKLMLCMNLLLGSFARWPQMCTILKLVQVMAEKGTSPAGISSLKEELDATNK